MHPVLVKILVIAVFQTQTHNVFDLPVLCDDHDPGALLGYMVLDVYRRGHF